jgi:integral membrane protein (TIGR01906 family)
MLTLGLIMTIIVLALGAWDMFFDTFHELFFEAGTWRFEFSDTLIRLFPEQFWFDASVTIGILTTIGAILILVFMWQWSKKTP